MTLEDELWNIISHNIPASHPRGYSRGVLDETKSRLRLAVKQYTPRSNPTPSPGDLTIIFNHGVGSTKESYEPFFSQLLLYFPRIRAIWAVDIAWHGASYMLNREQIGDEPHWNDSTRDLLQLVNYFQEDMTPPLVGMGQSWGCFTILSAAAMHPRLFACIVALEPTLVLGARGLDQNPKQHIAVMMMKKSDVWKSREEARRALLRTPYYQAFNERVMDKIIHYDLRPVDDRATPMTDAEGPVTLTTPKAQEAYSMMRADPPLPDFPPAPGLPPPPSSSSLSVSSLPRSESGYLAVIPQFHRPESSLIPLILPHILPPVLLLWGTLSYLPQVPGYRSILLSSLGTGMGGSGGIKAGKVREVWIRDAGHPLPLEVPEKTAERMVAWLEQERGNWLAMKDREERERTVGGAKFWVDKVNPGWLKRAAKF